MNFKFENILLPDGSDYLFLDLVSSDNNLDFTKKFESLSKEVLGSELKILLPISSNLKLSTLSDYKKWETNFFLYSKTKIDNLIKINPDIIWKNISAKNNLEYFEIKKTSSEIEKKLALEFMKDSFGIDFIKKPVQKKLKKTKQIEYNFPKSLNSEKLRLFKIYNSNNSSFSNPSDLSSIVGYFAIFESANLIQFHSVAGFSFSEKKANTKNRLGIITSAAIDYYINSKNSDFKKFFFTCSKPVVLEKYLKLGLEVSNEVFGLKKNSH